MLSKMVSAWQQSIAMGHIHYKYNYLLSSPGHSCPGGGGGPSNTKEKQFSESIKPETKSRNINYIRIFLATQNHF